ncbi:unnamed protein product [Dibothriocephalus latus]|uniref:Uncharacterized protein n=1 Tax=Dibothriocephalus latus TaxID=60516 RepID=A0A3P6Q3U9_DIBLA|nr:unnamed protein product [Dibothriocephalus latus]
MSHWKLTDFGDIDGGGINYASKEPCLQGLLSAERSTCPDCRQGFSREDVRSFRTLNAWPKRIQEAPQANQQDNLAICPICVRQVETPLKMSELFSKMVCGDCWRTGEMLRESIVEERIQPAASRGIIRSGEVDLQGNQQARNAWCHFCSQWVDTPLQMTQYFTKPVCNDCSRSAERPICSASRNRSRLVGEQDMGYVSDFAPGEESGDRVNHIERRLAQNPPAAYGEGTWQDNQQARGARCPICS